MSAPSNRALPPLNATIVGRFRNPSYARSVHRHRPIASGLVLVVYTERDEDTVRIISARWTTKREAAMYREHVGGRAP